LPFGIPCNVCNVATGIEFSALGCFKCPLQVLATVCNSAATGGFLGGIFFTVATVAAVASVAAVATVANFSRRSIE
jgi:hypothetical protein